MAMTGKRACKGALFFGFASGGPVAYDDGMSLLHRTRRQFFQDCGVGLGPIALGLLAGGRQSALAANATSASAANLGSGIALHHPPRAKRVIYLFQAGAPSQLELFTPKPKLRELDGKPIPPSVIKGQRYAFIQPDAAVLAPRFPFARHGQSGATLSDQLPHLAKIVDELAFVHSVHTDQFNHAPAQIMVNTGNATPGRPSMGSWLAYGLGSETRDLPAFVVLKSGGNLSGGAAMWSSGQLPGRFQGIPFRETGDPILHASNPAGISTAAATNAFATPKSPPASPPMRWRSACRPPRPS